MRTIPAWFFLIFNFNSPLSAVLNAMIFSNEKRKYFQIEHHHHRRYAGTKKNWYFCAASIMFFIRRIPIDWSTMRLTHTAPSTHASSTCNIDDKIIWKWEKKSRNCWHSWKSLWLVVQTRRIEARYWWFFSLSSSSCISAPTQWHCMDFIEYEKHELNMWHASRFSVDERW